MSITIPFKRRTGQKPSLDKKKTLAILNIVRVIIQLSV